MLGDGPVIEDYASEHNTNSNQDKSDSVEDVTMRSPTSVVAVSSASLLPSAAASCTTTPTTTKDAVVTKPFFVMDWLEEINPRDLELARQMIQTPRKKKQQPHQQSTPVALAITEKNCRIPETPLAAGTSAMSTSWSTDDQVGRSSIALPSLIPNDESSNTVTTESHKDTSHCATTRDVCRRIFPTDETLSSVTPNNDTGTACPLTNTHGSTGNLSSATSLTSASSAGSQEPNSPTTGRKATSAVAATSPLSHCSGASSVSSSNINNNTTQPMSPFKKRSIAIGNGYNAKGLAKAKKGSWESALACWENALEIRTQVLGETHPDVANTCNNIGIALGKLERYDAAIEVLERALELRAKYYGTREHVEVAATLHNIGNVLHAAQDCAGAIQCFWDAKLLQEQLLGPNHVQVARACVAIGNVYYEAMQHEDAREAYCDALQIFSNANLPQTHPEVMAIREDLQDIERLCARQEQQRQLQAELSYPYSTPHYHDYHHQQSPDHHPQTPMMGQYFYTPTPQGM